MMIILYSVASNSAFYQMSIDNIELRLLVGRVLQAMGLRMEQQVLMGLQIRLQSAQMQSSPHRQSTVL